MGYTGGTTSNPTYQSLGDHSESIRIEYDPTQVSFADLLDLFWSGHDPATAPVCRQYMSGIFYHDEAQRLLAEQTRAEAEALWGTVYTEVAPVGVFWDAEEYHQKWHLKNLTVLVRDFGVIYPYHGDFVRSTAAARVNGVAGREYPLVRLERDLPSFGLSPEANALLLTLGTP